MREPINNRGGIRVQLRLRVRINPEGGDAQRVGVGVDVELGPAKIKYAGLGAIGQRCVDRCSRLDTQGIVAQRRELLVDELFKCDVLDNIW